MAQTIGQHGVAAFTNPSNGDALDATVVKGNDNSIRSAYVDHDSDPGIHVQSSLLSARPVAGVAGRKWITTDTGSLRLWFDNGSAWEAVSATTPNALTLGSYLTGTSYDGSAAVTTNVNASTTSAVSTVVARDAAGEIAAKKVKLDGSTSGVVGIQAAAIAGTWTATLPNSAGTTGQVLTTDGSGGLSWTTTAGASISISESTTSAPFYPVFFSATSGSASALNTDGSLSWNPGTNTLDVVGPASVRSVEFDGTTSGTVTVQPAATAGTWSLTLPTTAGTSGQVLSTNGSGVTSWSGAAAGTLTGTTLASGVTASSLTSVGTLASLAVTGDVTVDTSTLKVDSANNRVGIGTASPTALLDVLGAASVRSVEFDGTTSGTVTVQPAATAGTWSLTLPTTAGSANQVLTTNGSGVTSWASPAQPIDEQTFNTSGTWIKPSIGSMALIECWGGGGGGSNSTTTGASGGAGGNYVFRIVPLSVLTSATVTVGAGGAGAASSTNNNGGSGGTTTFAGGGAVVTAAGSNTAQNNLTTSPGVTINNGGANTTFLLSTTAASISPVQVAQMAMVDGMFSGGYGGNTTAVYAMSSVYGGGGGGGQGGAANGASRYGGNGGNVGVNGTAPGGGGGSGNNATAAGSGAAGRVKVTVW